jgi:transcriptional regulator with XRE-family HTH domain
LTAENVATDVHRIRSGVGHAIHTARTQARLSMRELAEQSGVSQPFISAVERGLATPSISTLYRLAEVLDTEPAALLPVHRDDEVSVIRAAEGRRIPSSDRPNSAVGRVLVSDENRHLEVYEYVASRAEDLDVWFEHPGDVVLYLLEGRLHLEFAGRPDVVELGAGDCVVHQGSIPHRWAVEGDEPAHIFLVVIRRQTG